MANAAYNIALQKVPLGSMPWGSGTVKATLVNASYTYSSAHTQYSDISAYVLSGVTDQTLTSNAVDGSGNASADSITFSGVTASQTVQAVIVYFDYGGGVTSLMWYFDTGSGFPLSTTGADITIDWNNTPSNGTVFVVS
jgi:hypothetical protein